jgi:DedD protein
VASDILRRLDLEGALDSLPFLTLDSVGQNPMVDARVKERLTGAIILVALLVLLVPELLSGPSRSTATASAPSVDGQQMRSYTIDLADDAGARRSTSTVAAAPAPARVPVATPNVTPTDAQSGIADGEAASGAVPPDRTTSAAAPVETPSTAAPARAPAIVPPPNSAPPPRTAAAPPVSRVASSERRTEGGWAVQVGSFASRENAERLARELKGKGFESHVSESSGKGKRLWRVRVGPEPDRASAAALSARLRASGQSGSIVPVP